LRLRRILLRIGLRLRLRIWLRRIRLRLRVLRERFAREAEDERRTAQRHAKPFHS
jgi:hypothetical protein